MVETVLIPIEETEKNTQKLPTSSRTFITSNQRNSYDWMESVKTLYSCSTANNKHTDDNVYVVPSFTTLPYSGCRRRSSTTSPIKSCTLTISKHVAIEEKSSTNDLIDTAVDIDFNNEPIKNISNNLSTHNKKNKHNVANVFNSNNCKEKLIVHDNLISNYNKSKQENPYQQNKYNDDLKRNKKPRSNLNKMQLKKDAVGHITGEWGKWQLRAVLLIFLCKIPSSWFMACIIFTAPAPRHGEFFCKPPSLIEAQNQSNWVKVSHPQKEVAEDHEFNIDFCNVFVDAQEHAHHYFKFQNKEDEPRIWQEPTSRNANVIPCTQFHHNSDYHSVVTQYDLVCSRDILVSVTQFFHLFGVLTGGILAFHLLKYFSPRSVMLFGMVTQIFCGTLTGQVASYELHVFFRCLSAVCCAQMYTAGGVIMGDITGGKYKIYVITLFEQFWSVGVILLPGVASFFASWSHLYLAISWPTVVLIYLWRWIPESPRWMLARGRISETKQVLLECAEVNKTHHKIPQDLDFLLQLQAQSVMETLIQPSWWALWSDEKAIKDLICVHLCWSIYIVVYYGMLLNIRAFSRDHLEVNTIVAGCSEIIGTFIGLLLILKNKRKWLLTGIFNIVAGILALLGWLVPEHINVDSRVAMLMFTAMISKMAISSTLSILTTCTVELVTMDKNKIVTFSTLCWARFWLLGAPFIGATIVFGQLIPQTAYSLLAILGGIITTFITSRRTLGQLQSIHFKENMATSTQLDHIKGLQSGCHNPVFTNINKMTLPVDFKAGTWITKPNEESLAQHIETKKS